MKTKFTLLLFSLGLFLQNCGEPTGLAKANKDQLQSFLKSNQDYKLFVDAHCNNLKSLGSLTKDETELASDLIAKVSSGENVIENANKLYNLTKMEYRTLIYFKNFADELNLRYKYEQKDLVELIQVSLQEKLSKSSANGRTALSFPLIDTCGIYCSVKSSNYRGGLIYNGIDTKLATAAGNAYYLGCVDGCKNPQ